MLRRLLLLLSPLALLTACTMTQRSATIERRDAQTVYWNGPINLGDEKRFEAMLTPETRRVVINSGGGEVTAGLRMGLLIHKLGLDVEVDTYCGSSCANYIFTAGKRKIVPPGAYVGFHGDPRSSPAVREHLESIKDSTDPKHIQYRAYAAESERLTDEFYAAIGINPKLYAYSVRYTLSNGYSYWAPSPKELECMNVRGLEMWFSEDLRSYTYNKNPLQLLRRIVGTSAQDQRLPKPDICADA